MPLQPLTEADREFVEGFFHSQFEWVVRNRLPIERLHDMAHANMQHFMAHPMTTPQPEQLMLAMFLQCVGKIVEFYPEVVQAKQDIQAQTAVTPEDARGQVQALLTKIKSELG